MDLAIWNTPPAEFLISGLTSGAVEHDFAIKQYRPEVCAARLVEGSVDVALLPTMLALQARDAVDIVPSVGLVSWKYPFARLAWKGGLHDFPDTIAYDRRVAQERLVTRVILNEHYGIDPAFVPYEDATPQRLLTTDEDAALLTGPDVPTLQVDTYAMDIGQQWYELTNYPMVWGLFVARRDQLTDDVIETLIDGAMASDEHRDVWAKARETSPTLHDFYRDSVRTGLDKLAIASLTELRKYLFYYDATDDIPDVPFVFLDEDTSESDAA
jgi:hypothetical protein